jgi:uncharacterized membrane protein
MPNMNSVRIFLMILVGLFALNHLSWTQETASGGTISGTVVDKFGEPLKEVRVTAKNVDTEQEKSCNTDEHGAFKYSELPAGNYKVTAKKDGYMTHMYTNVIVEIGKTVKLNIKLDPPGMIYVD